MQTVRELIEILPQRGTVEWIGLRPARRATPVSVDAVEARPGLGLDGDHYASQGGKRQVTLIQAEHLEAIASMLHRGAIDPAALRRNVVIRGINLLALKDKRFRVGQAVLEFTGLCHPCSRMEAALGPGGYNSLRGHGGITASVLEGGPIHISDAVAVA